VTEGRLIRKDRGVESGNSRHTEKDFGDERADKKIWRSMAIRKKKGKTWVKGGKCREWVRGEWGGGPGSDPPGGRGDSRDHPQSSEEMAVQM